MDTVRATAYLVVKATRSQYQRRDPETGLKPVDSVKIIASRQTRPEKLGRDEVLVKVTVELPTSIFDPYTPEATIVVPEGAAGRWTEVQVEGTDDPDVLDQIEKQLQGVAHVRRLHAETFGGEPT